MTNKALPGNSGVQRREHLRAYLSACVRDNILSPADLTSPGILRKLLRAVSDDLDGALTDLGKETAAGALEKVAGMFLQLAQDLGGKK